jgi:2-keto-4-pentenoate hydratase/2-oxohepta-3-ene-1,7-dioic acid hydratase in catechol pathway
MKIICVGRNYKQHAEELANEVPDEPVIFLKPATALLNKNKPFYIPDFTNEVHYEAEVVIRVGNNGKYIEEKFATKYMDQLTLGIDFTARDLQRKLKAKKVSWELAKAFDNSAAIGDFINLPDLEHLHQLNFSLEKNRSSVQEANTRDMIFTFEYLISFVSRFFSLQMGDLIFTGTPAGVGPVAIGDQLLGKINGQELFNFKVK